MPFSLELPMNTPDWTDVGSGVRECYSVIQQPDIPTNRLVYPVPRMTARESPDGLKPFGIVSLTDTLLV